MYTDEADDVVTDDAVEVTTAPQPVQGTDPNPRGRKYTSNYGGTCTNCQSVVTKGDEMLYAKERGGIVGCKACAPILRDSGGTTTWVARVSRIRMIRADGSFVTMTGELQDASGPDASRFTGDRPVSFVGPIGASIKVGDTVRLLGSFDEGRYGPQVKVIGPAVVEVEDGDAGVLAFLQRMSFVGPVRARALVARYGAGDALWDALENKPDEVSDAVSGITPERAALIVDEFRSMSDLRDNYVAMSKRTLSPRLIATAIEAWGVKANAILNDNVYALLALNASWAEVDRIALGLNYEPLGDERLAGVALMVARGISSTGSTYADLEAIRARLLNGEGGRDPVIRALTESGVGLTELDKLLEVGTSRGIIRNADLASRDPWLAEPALVVEEGRILMRRLAHCESGIARNIRRLTSATLRPWTKPLPANVWSKAPTEKQVQAVEQVRTCAVSMLTGFPGTGKTTTVRAIVKLAQANGSRVIMSAPTGKAAQVLTAATGVRALTNHRLLARHGWLEDSTMPSTDLPGDLWIVDECSMVDVELGENIFSAARSGMRVLIVGDPDQLASVGPGQMLQDMIDSGVIAHTHLTEVKRQAETSPIPFMARDVRDGVPPEWPVGHPDVAFVDPRGAHTDAEPGDVAQWIQAAVVKLVTEILPGKKKGGVSRAADILVISPQHGGAAGVEMLNTAIQRVANPLIPGGTELPIDCGHCARPGDPIANKVNRSDNAAVNGDRGRLVALDLDGFVLSQPRFYGCEVIVPDALNERRERVQSTTPIEEEDDGSQAKTDRIRKVFASKEEDLCAVVEYPGVLDESVRYVAYTRQEARKLRLAYAVTTHGAQGVTEPCVLYVLSPTHAFTTTRASVFTAMTRSSKFFCAVGTREVLAEAVVNTRDKQRATLLAQLLRRAFTEVPQERPRLVAAAGDDLGDVDDDDAPGEADAPTNDVPSAPHRDAVAKLHYTKLVNIVKAWKNAAAPAQAVDNPVLARFAARAPVIPTPEAQRVALRQLAEFVELPVMVSSDGEGGIDFKFAVSTGWCFLGVDATGAAKPERH